MKLVDILARELKVWPEGVRTICQGPQGWLRDEANYPLEKQLELSSDWQTAKVTCAEWQAAVEALKAEQAAELKWPDGATHYVPPQEKNENGVFYLVFNDNAIYSWALLKSGVDNGRPVYGEVNRHYLPGTIPRPTERAVEWDGVGLPPIGAVCEFQGDCAKCPSDPWHKELHDGVRCTVIAHFKSKSFDLVAFTFVKADGNSELEQSLPGALRPTRTQEQIAAEEREKAINEMILLDEKGSLSRTHFCGLLYDANYRKKSQ